MLRGERRGPSAITPHISRQGQLIAVAAGAALFVMTLAVYSPAFRNGFAWDDNDYVQRNQTLQSADGLRRIWLERGATPQYYPLVFTTFWIEYHFWELRPEGYHVVNVLLHAAAAVLLWRVLRRLAVPGAWFAAAIFALHPVHVESVAWITERKNVLSGVFYLATALVYLRWQGLRRLPVEGLSHGCNKPMRGGNRRRPEAAANHSAWLWYAAVLILFVCALLSKTVTCTLPAALVLVVWWKRGRIGWGDVAPLIPLLAIGAALGLNTIWMERHSVGAQGNDWNLTFVERFLIAGRAIWFYLGKLAWPTNLTFIYPRWILDTGQINQYAHPLGVVAMLAVLWSLRRSLGRGPLTAALFFCGTLLPALGFIDVFPMLYSFVADHFQYLASIGPITLVVGSVAWAIGQVRRGGGRGVGEEDPARLAWMKAGGATSLVGGVVAGTAMLACMGVLTWRQCPTYANEEALWRDTLSKNPDAAMARINLGNILSTRGEVDEAIGLLTSATQIDPRKMPPTIHARTHFNLANTLGRSGHLEEAMEHYREALRIQPRYYKAHHGLGSVYERRQMLDEAIAEYQLAVQADPNYTDGQRALQSALEHLRRREGGE